MGGMSTFSSFAQGAVDVVKVPGDEVVRFPGSSPARPSMLPSILSMLFTSDPNDANELLP